MLDHVQLLVERFPETDPSTQLSLLRLLGSALAQRRSRQLWLTLGRHTGTQRAVRRAAAPHVAAWRATGCQRLWTLLARAHSRLLWLDARFFEDTMTAEFVESMSPYTVCVAVTAGVRMRPHLQPRVWDALMRRVTATAADMDDTSAHESFRMFAHLAPPWRAPAQEDDPPATAAVASVSDYTAPWHPADGPVHSMARADHAVHAGHPDQHRHSRHISQKPFGWAGRPQGAGEPVWETGLRGVMHGDPAAAAAASGASALQTGAFQESFDAFLGGSAGLPSSVLELGGPAHEAPQHAAWGSSTGRQRGMESSGHRGIQRHARVWVAEQLPEGAWREARLALERRLQLSVRDAADLRRQLRRASAADLQLNVWLRERMAAQVGVSHRARRER